MEIAATCATWCRFVQIDADSYCLEQLGRKWCNLVQIGAVWCNLVCICAAGCNLVQIIGV